MKASAQGVSAAGVLSLVDHLEAWKRAPHLALLWRCPTCRAAVGAPCVRPNGKVRSKSHLNRQALRAAACSTTIPRSWRLDLLVFGMRPCAVLADVRRSRLYRRLAALGLLEVSPAMWVRGGAAA